MPLILVSRKVSYADQGAFSFAFYPNIIKLLWAPLVDSLYVKKIGKRKSWIVPCQFFSGIILFSAAKFVDDLINPDNQIKPNGKKIFSAFKIN